MGSVRKKYPQPPLLHVGIGSLKGESFPVEIAEFRFEFGPSHIAYSSVRS
jgi:hypothetical protein